MDEQAEQRLQRKRDFADFLDQDHGFGEYDRKIKEVMDKDNLAQGRLRLTVDLQDLQNFKADLHSALLRSPAECFQPFEEALDDLIRNTYPKHLGGNQQVRIGVCGEFGAHRVGPRQLTSELISQLVQVQGIVTRCSLVRPKLVRSVHYCERTGQMLTKEYRDVTANTGLPTGAAYPQRDQEGNPLETEFGLCTYLPNQTVTVQVCQPLLNPAVPLSLLQSPVQMAICTFVLLHLTKEVPTSNAI